MDTHGPANAPQEPIRVRKRKRRSEQPIYQQRRLQRLRNVLLALLPLLLLGGAYLAFHLVQEYYESEAFLDELEEQMKAGSGLDVEIENLKWEGRRFTISKVTATAAGSSPVRQLELRDLEGGMPLTAWWKKQVEIDELRAAEGILDLSPSSPGAEAPREAGKGAPLLFGVIMVDSIEIRIDEFTQLVDGQIILRKTRGQGDYQIAMEGGSLSLRSLPALLLGAGSATLSERSLTIRRLGASFVKVQKGYQQLPVEITGQLLLDSGKRELALNLRKATLGGLLSTGWRSRLDGLLDGEILISQETYGSEAILEGKIALLECRYDPHTTFQEIARATGDEALAQIEFERDVTTGFRITGESGHLFEIDADQRGVLGINGGVRWNRSSGELQGSIKVGLAPKTVDTLPGGHPPFFGPPGDRNYSWATVDLSGTLDEPVDNLRSRLRTHGASGGQPAPSPAEPAPQPETPTPQAVPDSGAASHSPSADERLFRWLTRDKVAL